MNVFILFTIIEILLQVQFQDSTAQHMCTTPCDPDLKLLVYLDNLSVQGPLYLFARYLCVDFEGDIIKRRRKVIHLNFLDNNIETILDAMERFICDMEEVDEKPDSFHPDSVVEDGTLYMI